MDCLSRVMRLMVVVTSAMRSRLCLQMLVITFLFLKGSLTGTTLLTPHGFLTL